MWTSDMYRTIPVIFTGLSLSAGEACRLLPADIRPPVKCGDLEELGRHSVVAIIDGELDPSTLVSADEIRSALRRGVTIYGTASVGALRAAELSGRGMIGMGWVYEGFCSGRLE